MPACTNNGPVTVNNVKIKHLLQCSFLSNKTITSIMALFNDMWSFDGKTTDEVVRAYTQPSKDGVQEMSTSSSISVP